MVLPPGADPKPTHDERTGADFKSMTAVEHATCRNLLLQSLTQEDFALLAPHFTRVSLDKDQIVAAAHERLESFCFPEGGVASYSDILDDGTRIGIGMVGCEGLVGWPLLLGCEQSPYEANVAVGGGGGLRIAAGDLLAACRASPGLERLLQRFVQSFIIQLGRTVVSNLTDPVDRRLARWLLMNHDRLDGDQIDLTHQQLGVMLGVRRATVTDVLHILEGDGLVRSLRGHIMIRDRPRLRQLAGQAYGFAESEYRRLIGPFGKDR